MEELKMYLASLIKGCHNHEIDPHTQEMARLLIARAAGYADALIVHGIISDEDKHAWMSYIFNDLGLKEFLKDLQEGVSV